MCVWSQVLSWKLKYRSMIFFFPFWIRFWGPRDKNNKAVIFSTFFYPLGRKFHANSEYKNVEEQYISLLDILQNHFAPFFSCLISMWFCSLCLPYSCFVSPLEWVTKLWLPIYLNCEDQNKMGLKGVERHRLGNMSFYRLRQGQGHGWEQSSAFSSVPSPS